MSNVKNYLVGFIPAGTVKHDKKISKGELLKIITENLEGVDELIYQPVNPDNFHTDYIIVPVVRKENSQLSDDNEFAILSEMFGETVVTKATTLAFNRIQGRYYLIESGLNHAIHQTSGYRDGFTLEAVRNAALVYAVNSRTVEGEAFTIVYKDLRDSTCATLLKKLGLNVKEI